jgi:hypothetical protein
MPRNVVVHDVHCIECDINSLQFLDLIDFEQNLLHAEVLLLKWPGCVLNPIK